MKEFDRKEHWENVYENKGIDEVSWYQPTPETSLNIIEELNLSKKSKIIDIGGGGSFLVDNLLELGYTDITVLDISEKAIDKVKNRLGEKSNLVNWIVSDIVSFKPNESYDVWHDRAVFHFLTNEFDIKMYKELVSNSINSNGNFILGTFSENGPEKCSGIEVTQYSEGSMREAFGNSFVTQECFNENHKTPFETIQKFTFCTFKRK